MVACRVPVVGGDTCAPARDKRTCVAEDRYNIIGTAAEASNPLRTRGNRTEYERELAAGRAKSENLILQKGIGRKRVCEGELKIHYATVVSLIARGPRTVRESTAARRRPTAFGFRSRLFLYPWSSSSSSGVRSRT